MVALEMVMLQTGKKNYILFFHIIDSSSIWFSCQFFISCVSKPRHQDNPNLYYGDKVTPYLFIFQVIDSYDYG